MVGFKGITLFSKISGLYKPILETFNQFALVVNEEEFFFNLRI